MSGGDGSSRGLVSFFGYDDDYDDNKPRKRTVTLTEDVVRARLRDIDVPWPGNAVMDAIVRALFEGES